MGQAEEVLIDMEMDNPTCPLNCELPLRWGLPCRYWMYPAFIHQVPIPVENRLTKIYIQAIEN